MSTKEYAKIISKNLRRIASDSNKNQSEIARDLHISKATLSSWMNGTRVPRFDKIDTLADYFGVTRADIMGESTADFQISPQDKEILIAFRRSDELTQQMVRRLLGLREKKDHLLQDSAV